MNDYQTIGEAAENIALYVHVCAARRGYRVVFTGPNAEDHALAFMEARISSHAFEEIEGEPFDARYERLAEWLYPRCEHNMSADLCSGPSHYGEPGDIGWR